MKRRKKPPHAPPGGNTGAVTDATRHAGAGRKAGASPDGDGTLPDRTRELARFMEKLKDDPYWSTEEDDYPDEPVRPDWRLSYTDDPETIRGARRSSIDRHRRYIGFAKLMTLAGVPAFCEIARCRRQGICDGNRRERAGFEFGLYRLLPPCFFGFREVIREEFALPILFHARAIGLAPGPTYAPRLDPLPGDEAQEGAQEGAEPPRRNHD